MTISETIFDISIIIPAKDEQARLPLFLKDIIRHCQQSRYRYEIIIVDDGSTDATSQEALKFKTLFPSLQVITLERNHGKGYAVKQGLFAAQGNITLFLDADGSTPVTEIEKNLHFFNEGYDIVIGSRVVTDPSCAVKTKNYRKFMGIIFNSLVHAFLIKNIKDTQCGFKMFRRNIVRPLWARVYLEGFGFDLEVLFLAQKMNLTIKEVSVNWTHVDGSKVNLIRDSLRMISNIFQIRLWHSTRINTASKHMSATELANMYHQEKNHWWFIGKGLFFKKIIKEIPVTPSIVLDAGCGTGHNMAFLRAQNLSINCDIMHEALTFCRQNGVPNCIQCDLEHMPFNKKTFDLIVSLDVIEHVENPLTVLKQFHQSLNDNGYALIAVPAFRFLWSPHDEALSHMRRYSKKDLVEQLTIAGFKIEKCGYLFCLTFIPVAMVRLIRKLFDGNAELVCDTYHSQVKWLNSIMLSLMKLEAFLLHKIPFPFGTSLYVIAKKN